MKRRLPSLNEAYKISIEIDDEGGQDTQIQQPSPQPQSKSLELPVDSGLFGKYVDEMSKDSKAEGVLREAAGEINRIVTNVLEDVSIREDKREVLTAQHHIIEKVLREWRAFLREFAMFENRFGRKR